MATNKSQLQTVERKSWGGTYYDSFTHAAIFRKYGAFNFGVRSAQLFSSELSSQLLNKKFTYMTLAKKNVYMLPPGVDDYEWQLVASADVDFRITELLVEQNATPGKGGLPFSIAIDRPWPVEPVVFKTEGSNLPLLRMIGHPVKRSANSWKVEVKLQSSDPNAWIPVSFLAPGRTLVDATTSVSDELNTKYAGISFGDMFKLQSWVGNYARKAEFTDKFIRMEIGCRQSGRPMQKSEGYSIAGKSYYDGAVGIGYKYIQPFTNLNEKSTDGKPKIVHAGVFITAVEARLEERIMRDREFAMEFGQLEKTADPDSDRIIKVAPGWRQLVRDGHYRQHNGSLTLSDIYEYIAEIFVTRRTFSDRKIIGATGEAMSEFLHRLIAQEASQFQTVDTHFIRSVNSMFHENALEYGAQFTSIKLPNGYVFQVVHDPIKDDPKIFPEKAPGTNRTLESFNIDFFDFGSTDQKAIDARGSENMFMAMQDGVESYYTVSNVYDFETGAEKSGGNVYSNNKELGVYRETSGSLGIWDVTRIGRLEFDPYRVAV